MLGRLLETSTDDELRCPAVEGCDCPFLTTPKYDSDRSELSANGFVIMSIKKHQNLHTVLCAFEEQGWLTPIEWPHCSDADNFRSDTVYWLNRRQKSWLIDFSCDHIGKGLRWKFVR